MSTVEEKLRTARDALSAIIGLKDTDQLFGRPRECGRPVDKYERAAKIAADAQLLIMFPKEGDQ